MRESERLSRQFRLLYNGDPWIDVTLRQTLESIGAEKAAHPPAAGGNSIWEIVNHVISWRDIVMQRIHGDTSKTTDENYFVPVPDTSPEAWAEALQRLDISQNQWLEFLSDVSDEKLTESYSITQYDVADLIHAMIQHDAYHLGQIAMLAKHSF